MSDTEPTLSQSWYRVAGLRPRVRGHAKIHRHDYRDEIWYVLEDTASGRCHRISAEVHYLVGLMDGERTLDQIWSSALQRLGDDAPGQDEVIRLLAQMHSADVLLCDLPPDIDEIADRHVTQKRKQLMVRMMQPLAVRIPIFDPDAFLGRWLWLVRPLFSGLGLLVWLVVVLTGVLLAASHWPELSHSVVDRVLSAEGLLLLWLAYPLVKAVHELGHGFATKLWGGEVHEIGIMLLVLVPVPYVEASSASAFREKYKRALVGAIGIMVELFLAGLAMVLWVNAEPGLLRAFAFNVMLIGGVSTLFFNGNPLLRFDGYYVLCDLIEMPNLATRSQKYLAYLLQHYVFDVRDAKPPSAAAGERAWFVFYGIAAFLYRMFILTVIVLFIAGKFFFLGVILAIWAVSAQVLFPLGKNIVFLFNSPKLGRRRTRAIVSSVCVFSGLAAFLLLVPVPSWTNSQGVVWLPQHTEVRAQADGFVARVEAGSGRSVDVGAELVVMRDPMLVQQVQVLEARVRELQARLTEAQIADRSQAQVVNEELEVVRADRAVARERLRALTVVAERAGEFVLPGEVDLVGRYLRRGDLIGYITQARTADVRTVVSQTEIGLVRSQTESVHVRATSWDAVSLESRIVRAVPAATDQLPSRALGTSGGGDVPLDPRDGSGLTALEPLFVVDLALPPSEPAPYPGQRMLVRFGHGEEPLAVQWYRGLRQLFLSHFSV